MCKLRTSATILILISVMLFPQYTIGFTQDSQKPRKVSVKKSGWLIPGRDNFKHVSQIEDKNIEGLTVIRQILAAPTEIIVDADGKKARLFVKRKLEDWLFSVRSFSSYEVNGRIFAYGVSFVPVFFNKGQGYWEKTYAGAMFTVFYADEDGDGIYESRYCCLPVPKLPEWVRGNV